MPNWEFFYFLWDDPLFTSRIGNSKDYIISDPEFVELRRKLRLTELETLYLRIKTLERKLDREKQYHREAQAREAWTIDRFLGHVLPQQAEAILIDRQVNDIDPDFSFEKAITTKALL